MTASEEYPPAEVAGDYRLDRTCKRMIGDQCEIRFSQMTHRTVCTWCGRTALGIHVDYVDARLEQMEATAAMTLKLLDGLASEVRRMKVANDAE